mgnify:CR=1 FL=1
MADRDSYRQMLAAVQAFHDKHDFRNSGGEELNYRVALMAEELGEISSCVTKGKSSGALAERRCTRIWWWRPVWGRASRTETEASPRAQAFRIADVADQRRIDAIPATAQPARQAGIINCFLCVFFQQ